MNNHVIEEDDNQLLKELMTIEERTGFIKVDGYCFANRYKVYADELENFEVRDDDVWICSFPKTGTTWTSEMIWCIRNDLDLEKAKKIPVVDRIQFLEFSTLYDFSQMLLKSPEFEAQFPTCMKDSINYANNMPSPRIIKTHVPFELLPRQIRTGEKKPKILYCMRNPKDTCISYYHHCQALEFFTGTFEQFCTLFLNGKPINGPYWRHILSYWNKKDLNNLRILKYEDMKEDLPSVIKSTAYFLERQLTDEDVKTLTHHLSFESMKANPMLNYEDIIVQFQKRKLISADAKFIRCGKVNQWKDRMTSDVIEKFDQLTEKYFQGSGLPY